VGWLMKALQHLISRTARDEAMWLEQENVLSLIVSHSSLTAQFAYNGRPSATSYEDQNMEKSRVR
jgi:hypothetical protein